MDYEMLKLKNQLCFPLYACAKEVVRKYKPHLDEIGLTYTRYIAMMVLWEHRSLTVNELGEQLYLDSGTLTPLLKSLEASCLIKRERSVCDERTVNISLTEKGEALKEKAAAIPMKIGDCINLNQDEIRTLYSLLYKIIGGLER